MAKIQHDIALELYFSSSGPGMNHSKGSRIIPYYYRKSNSRAPQSFWEKVLFEWVNFTSHYGGRTSLRLGYFYTP